MKRYQSKGTINVPLLIVLVLVAAGAWFALQKTNMKQQSQQQTSIQTVSDLDSGSKELDAVDVDGLGNELPALDTDSGTF